MYYFVKTWDHIYIKGKLLELMINTKRNLVFLPLVLFGPFFVYLQAWRTEPGEAEGFYSPS